MAYFVLCAGGTGGHLFPAQALSQVLRRRGHRVGLVTDDRADQYGVSLPVDKTHIVPAASISKGSPFRAASSAITIMRGLMRSLDIFRHERPAVVVGFGGYPTVPPLLAARLLRIPIALHEQNAVLGRANASMSKSAKLIATSFEKTSGIASRAKARISHTGNPVRDEVLAVVDQNYVPPDRGRPFHLLVFGGSQGARVFADLVPSALEQMEPSLRARVRVTQQCRPEDLVRARDALEVLGVGNDLGSFFVDMPARIAAASLVIARSGASTVAELAAIGRPSILVPYPHALDHDQAKNAEQLEAAGGAIVTLQKNIGPVRLAQLLTKLMDDENPQLATMAAASKQAGRPSAAQALADEVEALASR
ncbi:MAG: undecaprenyldiphospho-muramoylpentapeptide beta-N-acetylglucosaminyltransferase [Pseudomonadota bacterium]